MKPFKKRSLWIFLGFLCSLLMGACAPPLNMRDFLADDRIWGERVGLETDLPGLVAGYRSIRGLRNDRYYLVQVLDENRLSLGFWFVSRNGILLEAFQEDGSPADLSFELIGRVSGGSILYLNNDFTYIVSAAGALMGYTLTYFDTDSFPPGASTGSAIIPPTTTINGLPGISLAAPLKAYFLLDIAPVIAAGNYEIVAVPVRPDAGISALVFPDTSLAGMSLIELPEAGAAADYIFVEHDGSGAIVSFRFLRVQVADPPLEVSITLKPIPEFGNWPPLAPLNFSRSSLEDPDTALWSRLITIASPPGSAFVLATIEWRDYNFNVLPLASGALEFKLNFMETGYGALLPGETSRTRYLFVEAQDTAGSWWGGRIPVTTTH